MKKRFLLSLVLAVVMVLTFAVPAFADTYQDVTVTAVPSFIGISNAPTTWTINGISGSGVIAPSTTYYTNPLGDTTVPSDPVVDGECRFTITNTSTVATDLTVNFSDFTGGDAMQNSEDGTADTNEFGAFSYCTGMTYSTGKVIAKTTGSGFMKENLAATTDIKWGVTVLTQTGAWSTGTSQTATVTITATAH